MAADPAGARPPALRASDTDHDAVLARLRDAVGEGRPTLEELAERTDAVLAARTLPELEAVTVDLPVAPAPQPPAPGDDGSWYVMR